MLVGLGAHPRVINAGLSSFLLRRNVGRPLVELDNLEGHRRNVNPCGHQS